MAQKLQTALENFVKENGFRNKGQLSVALVVTQHARNLGMPLDPEKLITAGGGQVLNLGRGTVQSILRRHGITKVLANEGGRTSRGSMGNMRQYVSFLNFLSARMTLDLDYVERFWIKQVEELFAAKPFNLRLDPSRSIRFIVADLMRQADEKQKKNPGTQYTGTLIQHLIGAKLACVLDPVEVIHHNSSTADAPGNRPGDFHVGDVAIHVTTAPSEAVFAKCQKNIDAGLRPVLITTPKNIPLAIGLAENMQLKDRIDIYDVEQFISLNLYEWGKFSSKGRSVAADKLIERYNSIVEEFETDPGLRIKTSG